MATLTWNGSHAFGVIWNTILNVQSDVAETTATRGSNDRRMCFDRRGVIFAVLDEFQSLYFANVIYCSKNGFRSIPYLAGNQHRTQLCRTTILPYIIRHGLTYLRLVSNSIRLLNVIDLNAIPLSHLSILQIRHTKNSPSQPRPMSQQHTQLNKLHMKDSIIVQILKILSQYDPRFSPQLLTLVDISVEHYEQPSEAVNWSKFSQPTFSLSSSLRGAEVWTARLSVM